MYADIALNSNETDQPSKWEETRQSCSPCERKINLSDQHLRFNISTIFLKLVQRNFKLQLTSDGAVGLFWDLDP